MSSRVGRDTQREMNESVCGEEAKDVKQGRERRRKVEAGRSGVGFIDTKEPRCVEQGMPDHPLAASFRMQARRLISY